MGATFGFGGKLARITNSKRQLQTGETAATGGIAIQQVLTEPDLVARSAAFEQAIQGGDRDALSAFCAAREAALEGSEEAETWSFLQTHFAADGRKYLLSKLGFSAFLPAEPEPEQPPQDESGMAGGRAACVEGERFCSGQCTAAPSPLL